MKRTGRILSLILALILIVSCFSFASALTLEDTYPEVDTTGAAIENFGVKLYFDEQSQFTEEKLGAINDHCFKLVDEEGHNLPIMVLYSPKEQGVVMVLFDSTKENLNADGKQIVIQGDTEYTLTISSDFVDDGGNELGVNKTLKFTTLNQKRNMAVNMILMAFLYAGIIIFSIRSAKKQANEQDKKQAQKSQSVNPYKEAKRTGKSVEEIVEKDKQNREKAAQKAAKKNRKNDNDDDEWEYLKEGHYRVGAPRTVASAGSTYITGRKAAAEKAKAEAEAKRLQQAEWDKKKKGKGKKK